MFKLAQKLNNPQGMSSAKLCLMTAYMMTARFKEGEEAGFEAYRLLPPAASLESRKSVLQEIALSCSATRNKNFLKYLQEYKKVLDTLSEAKQTPKAYSYLLLESLYADYYLNEGTLDEARPHLKKMDEYFSPTTYIPCRGLYYNVYSHYYRITKEYEKALSYSQNAIELLSEVSDNEGLNYKIEHASILTEAGQADEAIPLFQSLLAKKDSFYRALSISQTNEIYQMRNMDNLLLEKEQYKAMVHYAGLTLIAIALLILIPSTIRIYYVRKKLRKEEEEIRKMSQIAEEANEVKSRFLVNMSYNIRIPLNNVLGFSQLMTTDPESMDADQWKEYSEIIQTNSAELIQLVNDVLDLSRLEAGRTKWQIQEHEIISLCSDVLGMVRMRCGDKIQADFHTEIESQPFQVDTARFTQLILSTLIYTDPCEEKRKVSLYLERDTQRELFVFRVVNSPLADPTLQTQKAEVRHSINRLTIEYFKGTYTIEPNTPEGPVLTFTYPYSKTNNI
jgi:signal transduction histidine kinase